MTLDVKAQYLETGDVSGRAARDVQEVLVDPAVSSSLPSCSSSAACVDAHGDKQRALEQAA